MAARGAQAAARAQAAPDEVTRPATRACRVSRPPPSQVPRQLSAAPIAPVYETSPADFGTTPKNVQQSRL